MREELRVEGAIDSIDWRSREDEAGSGVRVEGRKNGAFSGTLGGSFGLLRCFMVSR